MTEQERLARRSVLMLIAVHIGKHMGPSSMQEEFDGIYQELLGALNEIDIDPEENISYLFSEEEAEFVALGMDCSGLNTFFVVASSAVLSLGVNMFGTPASMN